MKGDYDFIVVGAGSAGCVVAARLSSDPSCRVLLLEAGPKPTSPWLKIPGAVSKVIGPGKYNWGYQSQPEPELNDRVIYWPRGKTLGGSGAINGMVYLRGHPNDFENWRQMGNVGWGWDDVVPLFRRAEEAIGVSPGVTRYAFSDLFIEAAKDAEFPAKSDFNSDEREFVDSVGLLNFSIRNGLRRTSYDSFIAPVRNRRNLSVQTEAMVERIEFEGRRATGVTFVRDGQRHTVRARKEVILCGGAVNSPQLLMLSGIGPAAQLRDLGIEVVQDSGEVGQNLHDHANAPLVYDSPRDYSINHRIVWPRLAMEVGKYLLNRTGILAVGTSGASLFASTLGERDYPDIQVSVRPFSFVFTPSGMSVAKTPCVTVSVYLMRPASRGAVTLRSADAADSPYILANYLQSPADQKTLLAGLRLAQKIMSGPRMTGFSPKLAIPQDDGALLEMIRGTVGPVYHPCGTCRMGSDAGSVVDDRLRVRGLEGLRVADASIMPSITSTNINAACIMIGEKASDLVRQDWQ